MTIRVQNAWAGGEVYQYLLICGGLRVKGDTWNRATATRALDLLAVELPNIKRRSIRFYHV